MNKMYGFEGEVKAKYSANMCDLFTEVYNWLPLCHLLNHKVKRLGETLIEIHTYRFSFPQIIKMIYKNRRGEDDNECAYFWYK